MKAKFRRSTWVSPIQWDVGFSAPNELRIFGEHRFDRKRAPDLIQT